MMIPVRCTSDSTLGICTSFLKRTSQGIFHFPVYTTRYFARGGVITLITLLLSLIGIGQTTRTWLPTTGGMWTTASNWSPAGVPTAADTVVINTAQSAMITGVPSASFQSMVITGNCQLESGNQNSTLTITGSLFVGSGVLMDLGTGKMHLTIAAGANGNIQGIVRQSTTGTAKIFTCNGDLAIGPNGYIDGAGSFSLSSTGTLRIGSVNGITAGTVASGNIRVTGTRTYDAAAAYVYNGVASQIVGDGLPLTLTNSLTIDNPTSVSIAVARTLSTGSLNLVNGTLTAANLLTLGNSTTVANVTINRSGGMYSGTPQGSSWYAVNYTGTTKSVGQEISGTGFRNMTINLTAQQNLNLGATTIVPGLLTLNSGLINTSGFVLNLTGTLSGGNTSSYIIGNLQRSIAAGANAYTYPIGTGTAYAPVTLSFGASTVAGTLTGSTSDGDNAAIGLTTINSYRSVNRIWQFAINSGLTTVSYGAVFNWAAQDQDANFNAQQAIVGQLLNSAWTFPAVGSKTSSTIQATGLSAFGEFQVGQPCAITTITSQPVGGSICTGTSMNLSVQATGEGVLTYQWKKDGQDIIGANASTLAVSAAGLYSVVVTGECRSATSSEVEVTLYPLTTITTDPVGGVICPGGQIALTVSAQGQGTLSYQWRKDGVDIPQAVGASYTAIEKGSYTVAVTALCNTVISGAAIVDTNKSTSIVTPPASGAVCTGDQMIFRVNADGQGTLTYQWKLNGTPISGATSLSFIATEAGLYSVEVAGECGTVNSSAATLSLNPLTAIGKQPVNSTITYGDDAGFGLEATGTGELSYMWMVNNGLTWNQLNADGVFGPANIANLDLINPSVSYSGYHFKCVVSGACGQVESDEVTLLVNKALLTVRADNKEKVYGETTPALSVSYEGFVRGESLGRSGVAGAPSIVSNVDNFTPAGTYPIIPAVGSLTAMNYRFGFANGSIKVNKAPLQVVADDQLREYGDSNPELTASYNGFVNGENLGSSGILGRPSLLTTADQFSDVGDYDVTINNGTLNANNYHFIFVTGKLKIGKATLTVTADNKSKVYGDPNPGLTASFSGYKNGQTNATSRVTGNPSLITSAGTSTGAGTYPIAAGIGTLNAPNYKFAFVDGSLTINKAVVTVTADDKAKVYGAVNPGLTASYSGFVNGESLASSGISGTPSLLTTATSQSGVGTYEIVVSDGSLAAGNYAFQFEKGTLRIGQAIVTVKADAKSKIFGEENPSFTASYNGFVNGETMATSGISGAPSMSSTANAQSPVGKYAISINEGSLRADNYSFAVVDGVLTIAKAVITVKADDKSRIYGASDPVFTASYAGFVNGQSLATSGITGEPSFSTDASVTSNTGNYTITVSEGTLLSSNYSFAYETGKFNIGKATVTIQADNKQRTYGEANPAFTASYAGFVNGQTLASSDISGAPALTTAATGTTGAGVHPIFAKVGTLTSSNYEFVLVDGALTINKAVVTVTADDKTRVFGNTNPVFTASYTGFVNGETLANSGISGTPALNTTASAQSPVGKYDITIDAGTLNANNYSFAVAGGKLTVTKAVITVKADDKSRTYGSSNPAFTASYNGFVNGQTLTNSDITGVPAFSTDAILSSNSGNYTISVSEGTLSSSNYSFAYETGKLNIGKATVTVQADDKIRKYGEANPAFTASYSGFVNGETFANSGISGAPSLATTAGATTASGKYNIATAAGTLTSGNYDFLFVDGKLTVDKVLITVTADDKTRAYGVANPLFTASYTGFVNGETLANSGISGTPALNTTANPQSPVGKYDITIDAGTLSANNYSFAVAGGKLTVNKAVVTVRAEDKSRIYGASNPSLSVSYAGFANGQTLATSDITGTPVITTDATVSSGAGNYSIIVAEGTLSSTNYAFAFENGKLTIGKATVTIQADDKNRKYGEPNPVFTASYSGFVNGETLANSGISGSPSLTTTAVSTSGVAVYDINITQGTMVSSNYIFSFVIGKLSVDKALLNVKADDKRKVFGDPNPLLSASYIGLANGETMANSGITGTPVLTTTADLNSPVGDYPITIAAGSLASANYAFTYETGKLSVTRAIITVTAENKVKVYGQYNPAFTVTYSGFRQGEDLSNSGLTGTPTVTTLATQSSAAGTYEIAVAQGSLFSSNYEFEFKNGSFTIQKAVIQITAQDKVRNYGAANPQWTYTYSGLVNGETMSTSGITGTPQVGAQVTASTTAGTYPIVVSQGTLSSTNYSFEGVNGKLNIEKVLVVITAENKTRAYGQPNPDFTATYYGLANGETFATSGISGSPEFYTLAAASSPVGSYAISLRMGTLSSPNYNFTYLDGDLDITKAVVTVTADDKSRPYGQANPAFTASYNGFANGETISTSGIAGTPVLTSTATISSAVGNYTIQASAGTLTSTNYDFAFVSGKFFIGKATVIIKAEDKSKVYGQANPVFTFTYNGFANGETLTTSGVAGLPALTSAATAQSAVGSYDIVPTIGTITADNYAFTFSNGKLTVAKAMVTVKADNKSKVYGQANPIFTASYTGFVNGESYATSGISGQPALSSTVSNATGVGSYPISMQKGSLTADNYDFTLETGLLTVTKATITVTADDKSRQYGESNPTLTFIYNGFVNGETIATSGITGTPALSTEATAASGAGNYAINVATGTLVSSNYSFSLVNGKLVVGKATVIITADNKAKAYGEQNPLFTASYNGFVNGETLATSGITGTPSLTSNANAQSPVGNYDIVVANGTLSSANYAFTFTSGKLSIGKTVITVTADDKTTVYGQAVPVFTASYSGFMNGESLVSSGITGQPVLSCAVTSLTGSGSYAITIQKGSLASSNYEFLFQDGKLNITKAVITVAADNQSRIYGAANPAFTASYTGFVNGESMSTSGVSGTPSITSTAGATTPVGMYDILVEQGSLTASNYDFSYVSGKLHITKATVQVTATDAYRLYGAADPNFAATYEGFVNGETLVSSGITGNPSYTSNATINSPVGVYSLTPAMGTLASSNYQFEFNQGKYVIGKATVQVKANNANRLYGQANPGFTASITGLMNGETLATSGITGQPALFSDATASSAVGSYDIAVSVGSLYADNYTFSYEKGTLSIGKATVNVKADDKRRAYGVDNPVFTASFNGLVNGENLTSSGITGLPQFTTSATLSSEAGVYDIVTGLGTLQADNYTFTFEKGTLTIGRNIITVTADFKSKKYGEAIPPLTATYSGFLNGETLASSGITGAPQFITVADPSSPVGKYDIVVSKGSLASVNYDFVFVAGAIDVEKATITVTPANASRSYGSPNPSFSAAYAGFVNGETLATSGISGEPALTTSASTASPVGSYPIDGATGSLASSNYTFSFAKGNLQVTKVQLTVTADNQSRAYGSGNPVWTATFNGFVNGETLASSGVQGQAAFTTSANQYSPVGQYDVNITSGTLASDNYSFAFTNGKLKVTKAILIVKAENKSKVYATANPAWSVAYTGFVNGETLSSSGVTGAVNVTTAANTVSPAGLYEIVPTAGSLAASNYDFSFEKGTLTINKVTVTVKVDNKSRVYGSANPDFTATYNGFVNGETLATSGISGTPSLTTDAVANTPVGSYDINASTGTLAAVNYDFSFVKGTLQISKATITVKADNLDKPYGTDMPLLTASYIGLANGETYATSGITGSPVLTTNATALSTIGTYPINITLGTLESSNYSFVLAGGTITIGRAVITVAAQNKSRTYGEYNPQLTYTYSGFVNGETLASSGVSGLPVIYTNANVMTDAGDHDILVTAGTLTSSNYDFKFVKGVLTIKKAMLTVTPENKSRVYGAAEPAFTVTYSGFVYGELLFSSGISGAPAMSTTATATSPVGTYDINAALGTLYSPNYDFIFAKGTLTIGKATVLVRADNVSRPYGSDNPNFTASYIGFVNGETLATSGVTGSPTMVTSADAASLVGTYDIMTGLGTLSSGNYLFSFSKGSLTVTKAVINVVAENKSRLYWEDDPALTYTLNGFVNGETPATGAISGVPELSTDVIPYSNAGDYPIYVAVGTLTSPKYTFNMVNGTFTIRKRTLTVTPDNKARLYGQANPVFTSKYTGFVAGENYVSSVTGNPSYTTTAIGTSPIGTYDINASVGTLNADNYDFVFEKGTLTVSKAVLTVRADSKNKIYGATNPAMTFTYTGFMNGETLATSDVKGAPVFTTTSNLLSPVGDYPITIAQGTLTSDNYSFQLVNASLTVVKATIIVTADDKRKVYGTPNPSLSVSYSGFVNGETLATSGVTGTPVISTTATTASVSGNYDITATLGSLASSNYLFIFIKGTLAVDKAVITVTPDNKWRVYGDQNPVFTASYSGFINGESYANSGISGAPAMSTMATTASPAGSYEISATTGTLSAANYSFEFAKGTLNIGKATVTVTPDNKSRIYGMANPVLTASYSGFVNGETLATSGITGAPVLTTGANISSSVGTYDINAGSGSLSSGNYDFVFAKGALAIGKATITVTAENKSRPYGALNPAFTATYAGFVNGESYANSGITGTPQLSSTATAISGVGTYDINAATGTLSAVNYDFSFAKGTLTIGKATLTVMAESKGRLYGQSNPQFTVTYSGFVNGETLANSGISGAPAVATLATVQSPAGEYDIVPTKGTLASSNYEFAFENGKLWVGKVTLNVIADNKSRPYGSLNPALTITYNGFVLGETLATSDIAGSAFITTTAITSSPMGVYPINVALGTMSSVNYDFNFVLGTLTVGKATLTVTADNKSRTYGAANPTLTYMISGFVNGETLATSGVSGVPSLTTTANAQSPVGNYAITPAKGTLAAAKYDFVFVNGNLAVDKALITVTADNVSKAYGASNPLFTASYNGFMNGESLSTSGISGAPALTTAATAASPAGNYAISTAAGTLASGNYKFTYVNGVLTIGKAIIAVTADDKRKIYGEMNPVLTASYSGFVNGETFGTSGISGTPTIQTTANATSPAGSYDIAISAGSLLASNYDFRFVSGKLNIGKATIIVTPDNKSRIYGDNNPDFTASFSGFVNGEVLNTSGITGTPALSTMATALSPAGDYFIYAAQGTLAAANYVFSFENGVLNIGKAAITVTADNKGRTYGQSNPALTATYTGFKNGETFATSDITGEAALTTSATVASGVGNYPIVTAKGTLASGNYDFTYVNGVLTIGKATVTVTADDKSRIYGAANPAFSATYSGFVNGETWATSGISGTPILSTGATSASSVGNYAIDIANGSLFSVNYEFNLVKGVLTIGKATLTVTADNKSRIYGAANPDFSASYNGFVNGETLANSGVSGSPLLTTSAIATSPVGAYDINTALGSLSALNYSFNFVKGTLVIGKATILVTAEDKYRKYGESNPVLTSSYGGFVNGETMASSGITGAPALNTVAVPTSTVGSYEITAALGTLASSNYTFSFKSGMLNIGKAMITVTAEDKSKVYGSANPDLTASYAGYVNGESWASSGILGGAALTTVATVSSAVGSYPIVPQLGTLYSPNYEFSYINGMLTVTKATITVRADDKTRGYGEANPVLTASYSGFVNGEDLASSDIAGSPWMTTTASQTSSLGTYPIAAAKGSLSSGNYDFILVNGILTIGGPVCNVSGSLVVADNCYGSKISLTYVNPSFAGPYTLTINDTVYTNVFSGVPFVTAAVAKAVPESIWSASVIGEDPAVSSTSAIEVGVRFRPNVEGQVTGIRFYKRSGNTGTHAGSLWKANGELLARATFTNETATGWQQVNFSTPVTITPGEVYVASYYAPKGNVAYTANAFTTNRVTNGTGSLTALKGSEGGNGVYKMGAGFPAQVTTDNGNYYVDVVFNNSQSVSRFNLTSVISAAGCATLSESIQAFDVKMQPLTGVTVAKQDPICLDGTTGSITLAAIGCNTPYSFSIDNGASYSSNTTFTNLGVGTYQIKVKDASNYTKDTVVVLSVETAVWTGEFSTDWHNAANWSTGKVPSATTHVIIPFTAKECYISAEDVTVSSIQIRQGAIFRAMNNRKVSVAGKCTMLPSE